MKQLKKLLNQLLNPRAVRRVVTKVATPAAMVTALSAAGAPAPAEPPEDAGFRGANAPKSVVYKTVGGHDLRLFIRRPKPTFTGPRPAILLFHGGAWRSGSAGRIDFLAKEFASQGMVAIPVEYRLLPGNERLRVPQEGIEDARSAMRYARAHAQDLGIDPNRIAAGGPSAGGHLAMMTALMPLKAPGYDASSDDLAVSPRPQALVLLSSAYTGEGQQRARGIPESQLRQVTPRFLVNADNLPPTLMLHGEADNAAPYASAEAFYAAAKAAAPKADVTLVGYPGHGHGFPLPRMAPAEAEKVREAMHAFFVRLGWVQGALPPAPWGKKGGKGRAGDDDGADD